MPTECPYDMGDIKMPFFLYSCVEYGYHNVGYRSHNAVLLAYSAMHAKVADLLTYVGNFLLAASLIANKAANGNLYRRPDTYGQKYYVGTGGRMTS